jgi:uncharacterized protein
MASVAKGPSIAREPVVAASPVIDRIESLDVLRGVALFGILLMNITGMGLPDAYSNPANAGGAEGANLWAWIVTEVGFEGTQRGIFSMLFGASAVLFMSRLEASGRPDAGDIYVRRNLWLVAFGLVNAFILLWYGDILYAYGVTALFVLPFRKLAARTLFALGLAALLAGAAWSGWETFRNLEQYDAYVAAVAAQPDPEQRDKAQEEAVSAWEGTAGEAVSSPEDIAEAIRHRTSGYGEAFLYTAEVNAWWQSKGLYRYFFDIFGPMLIGMALFKAGVLTLRRPTWIYWAMLGVGYAVGLTVNVAEVRWIMANEFSALSFVQNAPTYDLGRLFMTLGHIGALLLFVRSGALRWLRRGLAAVGQMAVTNYLTHSLLALIVFVLLGQFGQWERHQLYYYVAAVCVAQLVLSPLWLRHFRFGPVEWVWRWLTYLNRPPMKRARAVGE